MYPPPLTTTDGKHAKLLTLVGLGLQVAEVAFILLLGFFLSTAGFVQSLVISLGVIGIAWTLLVYVFSYRRISSGDLTGARTPTLVFAVLSVFTGSVLSGLLYVLAYHELDRVRGGRAVYQPLQAPTALESASRVCPICSKPNPLSTQFCRGCGFALG